MKVTIEEIEGKKYTVVWHFDEVIKEPRKYINNWHRHKDGYLNIYPNKTVATALPPLPRYPKPEDVRLIHRYMAEGLEPVTLIKGFEYRLLICGTGLKLTSSFCRDGYIQFIDTLGCELTHCIDEEGNRIEVAIDG